MSKIIKLTLKQKSGLLTELESDTNFGHFCWRMKDLYGVEKLTEFLKYFHGGNPVFTISNSFFERDGVVYLPNPLLPHKEITTPEDKSEKIKQFIDFKKSKERKLLNIDEFNQVLNGNEIALSENTKIPKYKEDLRTSVEINRDTFTSKEGQLFSYAPKFVDEIIIDEEEQKYSDTKTVIFIKVLDEKNFNDYKCEEILKEVFEIGFGKKKSSGYGEFEIIGGLEEYNVFNEPDESNGFITLSNYLPSVQDELTDYYYDFKLKYGKLGEELALGANPFKYPIIFMKPGSVFKTDVKKDFYGRCTKEGEISSFPFVIQNGFAFSLRIKI